MACVKEVEGFDITWAIKNFSMCPEEYDQFIKSPVIKVKQFASEWFLELHPRGIDGAENYVSVFLACKTLSTCKTAKIEYKLLLIGDSKPSDKNPVQYDFQEGIGHGYNKWFPLETLKNQKNKYLPKDTLTVKCLMKFENADSKNTEEEMCEAFSRFFTSDVFSMKTNNCCIETIIPVQAMSFLWPIPRFLSLPENKRLTMPFFSSLDIIPPLYVTLFKNTESLINLEIKIKGDSSRIMFSKCTLSAANAPVGVDYCSEHEFLFKSNNDEWNFSPLWEMTKLDDTYLKFNDGILYLQFDFSFSMKDPMLHSEKQEWRFSLMPPKRQIRMEMFKNLDKEQSIVSLNAGGRIIPVHRSLLEAWSEVFHAMFHADMKEKETSSVDIPDIDPRTLGEMVSFFYSGTVVGDLGMGEVVNLYAASHKYQVPSLTSYCSWLLKSSLSISNVCDILKCADLYRDERLLETAESFIFAHPDRILTSQDWKSLMENNLPLAANVMYKMLTK